MVTVILAKNRINSVNGFLKPVNDYPLPVRKSSNSKKFWKKGDENLISLNLRHLKIATAISD